MESIERALPPLRRRRRQDAANQPRSSTATGSSPASRSTARPPTWREISNLDIEAGRFFTESEDDHSALVAVIGSDVQDQLFARSDPIGRTIWIDG